MYRQAFTLMELLLVVAIIALLVALLLPVFQQARKKSYEPVCTSNLRQFYVAFSLYREDYGDAPKYQARLLPYIKDKRILRCPAGPSKSGIAWFASSPVKEKWLETSYIFFRPFCDSDRDIMARHTPIMASPFVLCTDSRGTPY
ncbi:MAG: prepilin-type N-terminal cleavage/methylation domain-containing protein [Armatimonadota bacterium]